MKNLFATVLAILGGFAMISGIAAFLGHEFIPGNKWVQTIIGGLSLALGVYLLRAIKDRRPKKDIQI